VPIYEYQCNSCGHRFDELQAFKAPLLVKCPKCGQPRLDKLVSAASFHLKGSGWYATDFKNKGQQPSKEEGASEKKETSKEEKAATGKSGEAAQSGGGGDSGGDKEKT